MPRLPRHSRHMVRYLFWAGIGLLLLALGSGEATPPPGLTVSIEGTKYVGEGAGSIMVKVTLSAASNDPVTVQYTTTDNSAIAPDDYTTTANTLQFDPLETVKYITVSIANDSTEESLESFYVDLSNASGATIANSRCEVTIIDDDGALPTVQFDTTEFTVIENVGTVTLTVSLSAMAPVAVTVKYETANGVSPADAIAGSDYTAASGTLTFAVGETSKSFDTSLTNDATVEDHLESFTIKLSDPSGATLGSQSVATVTIVDDDVPPPTVQFFAFASSTPFAGGDYSVSEADGTALIAVFLSTPYFQTVTVDYSTSDGSALEGTNYYSAAGTLTFQPGDTYQYFTIGVIDDSNVNSNRTVNLALSNPQNASLGSQSTAVLTIIEANVVPTVQFASATYTVAENAEIATVWVSLSSACHQSVTIDYATSDGTATDPNNYLSASGSVTFDPYEIAKGFQITIVDDFLVQSDHKLNLTLSSPQGCTLGAQTTATLTIVDADALPTVQFTAAKYAVAKGAGVATISLYLSAPCTQAVDITYGTSDGSATEPTDYEAASGTLAFLVGETINSFDVPIVNNENPLSDRTVNLALTDPKNATLGVQNTATLTITETLPTVTFSPDPVTVNQGGTATLTPTVSPSTTILFVAGDSTIATVTSSPSPNLTVSGVSLGETQILAMVSGTQIAFVKAKVVPQDAPADSITAIETGKGVEASVNQDLGFKLDANEAAYGFKIFVTRADVDTIKNTTIKQEVVSLIRITAKDDKNNLTTIYLSMDKDEQRKYFETPVEEKDWVGFKKDWDKDGALAMLTLDAGKHGRIDGKPDVVEKEYKSSKLVGKQFVYADFPGTQAVAVGVFVGIDMYKTFRVTASVPNGKTVTAVLKMQVELTRVNGNWQKKTAKTDPALPYTWPQP